MNTFSTTDQSSRLQSGSPAHDDFGINVGERISEELAGHNEFSPSDRLRNVGESEQSYRICVGTALLAAAALAPLSRGWKIGLAIAGAAGVITGSTGYCPMSQLLGIDTSREDGRRA